MTSQVVFITAKIAFICTSLSAVHTYDFHIFSYIYIYSWLVSSVGRALHRHRRGHGLISRMGLFFFRLCFHHCSSSVHYCKDRFHIHVFIHIWHLCFSYIHSHLFPQLSAPCAYLVAMVFTLEYETTSSIFLRINQEPHKLWMASNNYVFGDGLLHVLNDYTCTHNTLG